VAGSVHKSDALDRLGNGWQKIVGHLGAVLSSQGVVVAESERGHAAFAFVLAELKRLQGQSRDVPDKDILGRRRDELLGISQTFRPRRPVGKEAELLGQAGLRRRMVDFSLFSAVIAGLIVRLVSGNFRQRRADKQKTVAERVSVCAKQNARTTSAFFTRINTERYWVSVTPRAC
jgi:hypothetical protein